MDCDVRPSEELVPVGKTGKRRKLVRMFRCIRCGRTFPYEAVLTLMGCKARLEGKAADKYRARRTKYEANAVKVVTDRDGKTRLEYS